MRINFLGISMALGPVSPEMTVLRQVDSLRFVLEDMVLIPINLSILHLPRIKFRFPATDCTVMAKISNWDAPIR